MNITVRHAKGSYDVEMTTVKAALFALRQDDLVVTDRNVKSALNIERDCFVIEPGESSKCLSVYGDLLEWLAVRGKRSSRIVAIGGGVVGDLAGFAAATFMRGVELLQVPTSLMALVDSSIGGKVGIDLKAGKNLAGAFWSPVKVLAPIDALRKLPARHFTNGAAEVWKYAFIVSSIMFDRLAKEPLIPLAPDLTELVMQCIDLKRQIVEEDEFEESGRRAILNFGHTIGHAIEQCQEYNGLLHGEAVAVGMVVETEIAECLGMAESGLSAKIQTHLQAQGLPVTIPIGIPIAGLMTAMARDKKARGNGLAFSFVSSLGVCKLCEGIPPGEVETVLRNVCR